MTNKLIELVEKFNELFPVGAKVFWRPVASENCEHQVYEVFGAGFCLNGQPVAMLKGKPAVVSITPEFVDYDRIPAPDAVLYTDSAPYLQERLYALEKFKVEKIKPFYEEYEEVCRKLHEQLGTDAYFQVKDTVFKTVIPDGTFVKFQSHGIVRTRFEGEVKGSLSMKEAREAGFSVEGK